MSYLRNTWYVAGWSEAFEAGRLVPRTFLDERIVLFRDSTGRLHALQDRCPHRFVPLHLGQLKGDRIQCGYHGLEFDSTGTCVKNPHSSGPIPKAAHVKTYPIHEAYGLAWIWMGRASNADASLIPDFSQIDADTAYVGRSYLHVKANYVLESDNILDLSHVEYLHASTLGSSAVSQGHIDFSQDGNTVYSRRVMHDELLTPALERMRGIPPGQRVDRWFDVRWDPPSLMLIASGQTAAGTPRENGSVAHVAHVFTPETERTTHYWFAIAFPKSEGESGAEKAKANVEWLRQPFSKEDMPMLEAQQQEIGSEDFWSLKPVLLPSDVGAVRARRVLDRLIKEERDSVEHRESVA